MNRYELDYDSDIWGIGRGAEHQGNGEHVPTSRYGRQLRQPT